MKNKITSNKNLKKANGLVKNTKKQKKETSNKTKKLGMGLSSLLSKDQELVSVIRTKVKEKVSNPSSLKIQMPKLSKRDGNMLSISNIKSLNSLFLKFCKHTKIEQIKRAKKNEKINIVE